jgi:hypothetical protein
MRNGQLVPKTRVSRETPDFPTPMVSRFEAMESPVTGRTISSWRERDRDMDAVGKVDPRDLDRAPFEKRNEDNARRQRIADDERDGDTA